MVFRTLFLTFLLTPFLLHAAGLFYEVEFQGVQEQHLLRSIKSVSQLNSLKKRPPESMSALRYRAEADRADILKVLHAHGYYEAALSFRFEEGYERAKVIVQIEPGPAYTLSEFQIEAGACPIDATQVGITLGKRIEAQKILSAELKVLQILADCGYPLAKIGKREMVADGKSKTVRITLQVDTGPSCAFGKVSIQGEKAVLPQFIDQKITWREGDIYNAKHVEETQQALLDTGLFSSVIVSHAEESEEGKLPVRIEVAESKHHSLYVGASYQTVFGPGLSVGWEDRNVRGMGRKLTLRGEITRISHAGIASYYIPDFRRPDQDLVWQAEAMHESITAYSMRSYNFMGRIERKFNTRFRASIGMKGQELLVRDSVDNGNFGLLQFPIYFRWSSADDLLNPTKGATLQYKAYPSFNLTHASQFYFFQEVVHSLYFSLTKSRNLVLAQKVSVGSILSHTLNAVPVPERFLGGSEEELRGYKYKTVSPLRHHHKPIGGRSAIYYTLETRWRVSPKLGFVPFFDLGNVKRPMLPNFKGTWRKSVGLGVRYFSYFGPLRLDVGIPLDPRKKLDGKYRIYVSIGQMF